MLFLSAHVLDGLITIFGPVMTLISIYCWRRTASSRHWTAWPRCIELHRGPHGLSRLQSSKVKHDSDHQRRSYQELKPSFHDGGHARTMCLANSPAAAYKILRIDQEIGNGYILVLQFLNVSPLVDISMLFIHMVDTGLDLWQGSS